MAITLAKGQGLSLEKSQHNLSLVTIGLGWDIAEKKTGFLGGLFGSQSAEYDLDVVAFLCDADGKVRDLGWDGAGNATLRDSDVIFFNNLYHRSGNIRLTGDNRTGAGDGDDEQHGDAGAPAGHRQTIIKKLYLLFKFMRVLKIINILVKWIMHLFVL